MKNKGPVIVVSLVVLFLVAYVGYDLVNTIHIARTSPPTVVQAAAPPVPIASPPDDPWDVQVRTNELDHSKMTVITRGILTVRCSPRAVAYISPPLPQLGGMLNTDSGYAQSVRYRKDDGPIAKGTWAISDTYDSLFLPTAALRAIRDGHTLTVEYQPEYVLPMSTSQAIDGLSAEMTKAGCQL